MRRFSFWFTFLASCLTAAWLTQTTLSHELCRLLQSADSRIQAISPLNGRLYILVNEQAYSLPLTAQTVVNNPGSLTLRSIEHLGHWTRLPFLGEFASLNNSETPLYQARLWFDYGKVSASLVFGKAASSDANTSTLLPEKQCFLDGPTVTCETYTPFGLFTKSSQSKVIRLDSPANFSVPKPSSILRSPPLGEQLIAVLNAQTPLYYKPGKERDISLPPNDYNLTSPEIGFIHGGKMHLWLPQTGTVLLLNVPPDIASITDWGVSTKLRTVPLAEYLHCTDWTLQQIVRLTGAVAVFTLSFCCFCYCCLCTRRRHTRKRTGSHLKSGYSTGSRHVNENNSSILGISLKYLGYGREQPKKKGINTTTGSQVLSGSSWKTKSKL